MTNRKKIKSTWGLSGSAFNIPFFPMIILSVLFSGSSLAQTNINGVVNTYTPVTAVRCNSVDVVSTSGFSLGDRVVLIQMKGASIDSSNSSLFGSVTNYNNCGNYEFASIASISGNTVYFTYAVLNNYTISGLVQLIRVGVYSNAVTNAPLTCAPWNGSVGGVLVLEVSNTLSLNSNIDVSGKGFRGGTQCTNPNGSCGLGYPDYFYPVSSGYGAEKGEGIAVVSVNKNGGMGALANGGGGGNKHNSGGGGGGNFSGGGKGGNQANFCPVVPVGGVGGYALNYNLNKIFLGGGGGCSDNNDQVGTLGGNGGGIVIIRAAAIAGNGYDIISDGSSVPVFPNGIGDGAGGGGAAGTILLSSNNFSGTINCLARGGNGGDQNTTYPACFGPGGGGGTGLVFFSLSSVPVNVNTQTLPGAAGIDLNPSSACYNMSYGAIPGQNANGIMNNLILPESNIIPISVSLQSQTNIVCGVSNSGSASVNASGGTAPYTYSWSPGGGTSASATGLAGGNYTVTVTDANGCAQMLTIIITSNNNLILTAASTSTACTSNTGTATANPSSGNPPYTYSWNNGQTTQIITALPAGNYTVTVTDVNGCSQTQTVAVNLPPPITVSITTTPSACSTATGTATAIASNGSGPYTYSWSNGQVWPIATGLSAGIYFVIVTDANGCTQLQTLNMGNLAGPTATASETALANGTQLTATGGGTYLWSPSGGLSCTNCQNPVATPGQTTTYCVLVTDANGCTDVACVTVTVDQCGAQILSTLLPNAFSPNGDMSNDVFCVPSNNCIKTFLLKVYDRWGEKIFETDNVNKCWDGTYNGKILNTDVFAFYLDAILTDGNPFSQKGNISLMK